MKMLHFGEIIFMVPNDLKRMDVFLGTCEGKKPGDIIQVAHTFADGNQLKTEKVEDYVLTADDIVTYDKGRMPMIRTQ
jgi:hypothetical protein